MGRGQQGVLQSTQDQLKVLVLNSTSTSKLLVQYRYHNIIYLYNTSTLM
jgi:hypothetical protein